MRIDTPWATDNANKLDLPDAQMLDTVTWNGRSANPRLSANFLPPSDRKIQVIVSRSENYNQRLTVYELESDIHVHISNDDVRISPEMRSDIASLSHDGKYLAARHVQGDSSILGLSGIQPGYRTWSSVPLPASRRQAVKVQLAPGNEQGEYAHVVASVSETEGAMTNVVQTIYSSPVLPNGTLSGITRIATASVPFQGELPATALPANGSILAYVSDGHELRAVFLDGTQDTLVASDVYAVWDLKTPKDIAWRR
jgi:hypothetical protein